MMTLEELSTRTRVQLEAAARLIGGRAWGVKIGKPRIYVATRKDVTAFFAFPDWPTGDDVDCLGGAAFRVFIADCNQHPNWYTGQKRAIMIDHYRETLTLTALLVGDDDLAEAIMARDEPPTAEELDGAAGHLVNGRLAEARLAMDL